MKCKEILEKLSEYIDGELAPESSARIWNDIWKIAIPALSS